MAALRAGDPEQARAAVREHFAYTRTARYVEHGKRSFREARTVAAERLGSPVASA